MNGVLDRPLFSGFFKEKTAYFLVWPTPIDYADVSHFTTRVFARARTQEGFAANI